MDSTTLIIVILIFGFIGYMINYPLYIFYSEIIDFIGFAVACFGHADPIPP